MKFEANINDLKRKISERGYETLRYSLFKSGSDLEWNTIIRFDDVSQKYLVYLTRDRAGKGKIFEFSNFKDAEIKFMDLLDRTVERNRYNVKNGWEVPYSSPLWDSSDD